MGLSSKFSDSFPSNSEWKPKSLKWSKGLVLVLLNPGCVTTKQPPWWSSCVAGGWTTTGCGPCLSNLICHLVSFTPATLAFLVFLKHAQHCLPQGLCLKEILSPRRCVKHFPLPLPAVCPNATEWEAILIALCKTEAPPSAFPGFPNPLLLFFPLVFITRWYTMYFLTYCPSPKAKILT